MALLTAAAHVACVLAARDAEDRGCAELEPEYVVMGLCKASGFRAIRIGDFPAFDFPAFGPSEIDDLRREAQAFVAALRDVDLDPVRLRLRLRELYHEAHPARTSYSAQRSPACRQAFDRAAELGGGSIGLFALALVLMSDPGPLLARALSEQQVDGPRLQRELARGLAAAGWPRLRCGRCGWAYSESENGDAACVYHPGRLRDYDQLGQPGLGSPGDFWECCMRQVQGGQTALTVPGCATGRHVEAAPGDPGPVRREIDEDYRIIREVTGRRGAPALEEVAAARERLGRFLDGMAGASAYPTAAAREDTGLIEGEDFPWLLRRLIAAGPAGERGRLIAGFLAITENIELVRRGTAPDPR